MNILEIKDLHTYFHTKQGYIKAVDGVSLSVGQGKTLGVIGESGSGKSQTAMSIMGLLEKNQKIHGGEIIFEGKNLATLPPEELRRIRGNDISMIFQEPMTSLNPVFTIEHQISEVIMLHRGLSRAMARQKALSMLSAVKIPDPSVMAKRYPHELSGGMRQRVMIAIALSCRPKLLIADEPTTALDGTIQAQILHLMRELGERHGTSIMFITHDLALLSEVADDIAVMYCGQVVEIATREQIFAGEGGFSHPYTQALLGSIPSFAPSGVGRLETIDGSVPHPLRLPQGCRFAPRCKYANQRCMSHMPTLGGVAPGHFIRCFNPPKKV